MLSRQYISLTSLAQRILQHLDVRQSLTVQLHSLSAPFERCEISLMALKKLDS